MTARGRHAPVSTSPAAQRAPDVAPPVVVPVVMKQPIMFTDEELNVLYERLRDYPCPYGREYRDWLSAVRKIEAEARRRG